MDFQDPLAENRGVWGAKCGKESTGGAMLTPNELVLLLGFFTPMPILAKIYQEMRL